MSVSLFPFGREAYLCHILDSTCEIIWCLSLSFWPTSLSVRVSSCRESFLCTRCPFQEVHPGREPPTIRVQVHPQSLPRNYWFHHLPLKLFFEVFFLLCLCISQHLLDHFCKIQTKANIPAAVMARQPRKQILWNTHCTPSFLLHTILQVIIVSSSSCLFGDPEINERHFHVTGTHAWFCLPSSMVQPNESWKCLFYVPSKFMET